MGDRPQTCELVRVEPVAADLRRWLHELGVEHPDVTKADKSALSRLCRRALAAAQRLESGTGGKLDLSGLPR